MIVFQVLRTVKGILEYTMNNTIFIQGGVIKDSIVITYVPCNKKELSRELGRISRKTDGFYYGIYAPSVFEPCQLFGVKRKSPQKAINEMLNTILGVEKYSLCAVLMQQDLPHIMNVSC